MIQLIGNIDISIAVRLENVIAKYGLFPDLNAFMPFPIDNVAFNLAIQAIRDSGKMPIKVNLPGTSRTKGKVVDSIIDIRRNYLTKGSIAFGNSLEVRANGPEFEIVKNQDVSTNIEYELRYICNNEYSHLDIDLIIQEAFGFRTWIPTYNENRELIGDNCGFEFSAYGTPNDIRDANSIERMYRFMAKDLFLYETQIVQSNIKPINTIGIDYVMKKDIEVNNDSTDNDLISSQIVSE